MNKREKIKDYKRIVVKVGTAPMTHPNGKINLSVTERFARVLSNSQNQGKEMVLVSSGAIAVGADRLALAERPRDTVRRQAAAAVGQGVLMQIYQNFFMGYNQKVAQILLTRDIFDDKDRKRNAKNTMGALIEMGVIPIVNENDTVSTEELGFSENDGLSALVASLVEAELLVILSDIEGLYAEDPRKNPEARIIKYIETITEDIAGMAGTAGSKLGSGGMSAKINAAKTATGYGIDTIIALGKNPLLLENILAGEEVGTFFEAREEVLRKI